MVGRLRTARQQGLQIPSVTPLSPKTHSTARLARTVLVLVAGTLVALSMSLAFAARPVRPRACGKKVLDDWWDNGRVDRLYPLHCYEEAIDGIPADIRRLLGRGGGHLTRAAGGRRREARGGRTTTRPRTTIPASATRAPRCREAPRTRPTGGSEAAPDVDGGTSSVPIPLLVLGGMSLALLAAGGLGYLSRRRHAAEGQDDENHPLDPLA